MQEVQSEHFTGAMLKPPTRPPSMPAPSLTPVSDASPDAADFEGQDQPPDAPTVDERTKRKRDNSAQVSTFSSNHCFSLPEQLYSKSKLLEWLSFRDATLDEILWHDGLSDFLGVECCISCRKDVRLFKCKDCLGGCRLRCQDCIVLAHQHTPLDRIEVRLVQ